MADDAIADGAEVKEKRKVKRPPPPVTPIAPAAAAALAPPTPELKVLRDEISQLRQALADVNTAHEKRFQELSGLFKALSEGKPMRLKPIRDMEPSSKTYLLVTHYDFVPVSYQRKLNS